MLILKIKQNIDKKMLLSNNKLKLVLLFIRIEKTISVSISLIERTSTDQSLAGERDRLEGFLFLSSVVYEGIKTLKSNNKKIYEYVGEKNFNQKDETTIKELLKEYGDNNSFINKTIGPIRNKFSFHYDIDFITDEILKHNLETDESILAKMDDSKIGNTTFPLIDKIIIKSIVNKIDQGKSDEEKEKHFFNRVTTLSNDLSLLLINLIAELSKDFAEAYQC